MSESYKGNITNSERLIMFKAAYKNGPIGVQICFQLLRNRLNEFVELHELDWNLNEILLEISEYIITDELRTQVSYWIQSINYSY